jgi:hypothetical protein
MDENYVVNYEKNDLKNNKNNQKTFSQSSNENHNVELSMHNFELRGHDGIILSEFSYENKIDLNKHSQDKSTNGKN